MPDAPDPAEEFPELAKLDEPDEPDEPDTTMNPAVVYDRAEADRLIASCLHPAGVLRITPLDADGEMPGVDSDRAAAIAAEVAELSPALLGLAASILGVNDGMDDMSMDDRRAALLVRVRETGQIDTLATMLDVP